MAQKLGCCSDICLVRSCAQWYTRSLGTEWAGLRVNSEVLSLANSAFQHSSLKGENRTTFAEFRNLNACVGSEQLRAVLVFPPGCWLKTGSSVFGSGLRPLLEEHFDKRLLQENSVL